MLACARELSSMLPDMRELKRQVAEYSIPLCTPCSLYGRITLPVLKKYCSTIGLLCMPRWKECTAIRCVVKDGGPVDFGTTAAM